MKPLFALFFVLFATSTIAFGQSANPDYTRLVKEGETQCKAKNFLQSAQAYSAAFTANGGKGSSNDRYNAACSWAQAGVPDSAFFNLNRVATIAKYSNYRHLSADKDLLSLHNDARWQPLLTLVKQNQEEAEKNFNKPVVAQLDSIHITDQKYRQELNELRKQSTDGDLARSREANDRRAELIKQMHKADSANLIKVTAILDKYGWLGKDEIGDQGNTTLFLVIQHAYLPVQVKYLPMMREAVKNGKARGSELALLEDRVALHQGKRQTYGSQVGLDQATQAYYVLPLDDPDHVDQRRAAVGLPPLAEYVKHWNIKWDVEQYKKDLPTLNSIQIHPNK